METLERKTKSKKDGTLRGRLSAFGFSRASRGACPACGTDRNRNTAKYCLDCGKILAEDYQPLDTLRSSDRLQGKSFLVENAETKVITDLFAREENSVAEIAWACFVYSMVPYLGILFIPLTFITGGFGVAVSYRYPGMGGRKLALLSVGLSFVVLALQVFLWWLLYLIPEIGKGL